MKTEFLIAERKAVEKALLASEQLNRSLIASTSDYVYTVTIEGGRADATSHGQGCEGITGFTPGEFAADTSLWYRMIQVEDRPAVLQQVSRILNGDAPRPLEHRIIHKDRTVRWVRNVAILRRNDDGQLVSYNGLISDITERKRAEQLLVMQYAVTRQLAEALRSIPIVFLTAAATKAEVFTRAGRIGGLPFLAKPVDMPELIACIGKHIR